MLGDFSLADLGDVGPPALLVLVVLLILTGHLVPGREMRYWRRAFFAQQAIGKASIENSKATRSVLKGLPQADELPPMDEEVG